MAYPYFCLCLWNYNRVSKARKLDGAQCLTHGRVCVGLAFYGQRGTGGRRSKTWNVLREPKCLEGNRTLEELTQATLLNLGDVIIRLQTR